MRRLPLIVLVLLALTAPALAAAQQATPAITPASSAVTPADACLVGRQPDGSVLASTDQMLAPTGRQIEFLGRPNAVALNPDGKTAAFLTTERDDPVTIVDLASGAVKQQFAPPDANPNDDVSPGASFAGIIYAPDGKRLYASDATGFVTVADVAAGGTLAPAHRIEIPKKTSAESSRPGGLALSPDGATLYVTINSNNSLGVIDLKSNALTDEIPVGNAPFAVVLQGRKAYVSNQGGRPAQAGDVTNDSGGTEIVADPTTGGVATGTVSVVDLDTKQSLPIPVGLQPTALALHGDDLFVANTNSDTVSVIDTATDEVVKTIAVQPFPGAPWGSSPNALAMIDGDRLVVSLGRNNALAVYDWRGPSEAVRFEGLLPTGWYPGDLAVDAAGKRIVVANAKGVGSLGPERSEGPEATNPTGHWVHSNLGSASVIPFPSEDELADATAAVYRNNRWSTAACTTLQRSSQALAATPAVAGSLPAIPTQIGDPSAIKHVFYIVKENRTYDQVLGDMPQGNGDPGLVQFGRAVTPNQHALAEQFGLFDNLYVSGSLSADGHQWVTQAFVDDYVEKAFGDFSRSYPYNGGDALAYAPTGFLWDNALRHGRSVRVYGEYANELRGPEEKAGTWADWYHDWQIMTSKASGQPHVPAGTFTTHSDVPSLDALLDRDFPAYATQLIPDQYRVEKFLEEFQKYEADGNLPNLVLLQLVQNHTYGTDPDFPTPRAMVADNDLALGRIVEAITKSRFWPESAIFVIEDDAQGGVDHVDGHRTTGWVISPYARRGVVDSTYYTQIDMVRTIEQILGLPPMNQMDLAATPMWDIFTDTPDLSPFTALPNQIPFDEMNPPKAALSGVHLAWAEAADGWGFGDLATQPDAQDERLLNRAIWYSTKGFGTPYPGDPRVLWPEEVSRLPGAAEPEDPAEAAEP